MKFVGTVKKVIYSSPTFSVFVVSKGMENIIVTSDIPVEVGETFEFEGDFTTHPRYGLQFKSIKTLPVDGLEASIFSIKGISSSTWKKLKQSYGWKLNNVLRHDPYRIAFEIKGVGFKKADTIAQGLGISKEQRNSAATRWVLESYFENGHTAMPLEEFYFELEKLNASPVADETVIVGNLITTKQMFEIEKQLAEKLLSLSNSIGWWNSPDFLERLKNFPKTEEFSFTSDQLAAFSCLAYPVSILTGGPGTGKTTLLKFFVKFLKSEGLSVVIAAPTGKAARRLEEVTGAKAFTIHKLLLQLTPNAADVLIIDETSMLSVDLALKLLSSLNPPVQIIFVGDPDQLPSIEPGNFLEDLINSRCFVHWHLTSKHRFRTSGIALAAEKVLEGKWPSGVEFIPSTTDTIFSTLSKFDNSWQLLVPMKRGKVGTSRINAFMQKRFASSVRNFGGIRLGVGDRIIWTKNDYTLMLLNGQVGKVTSITPLKFKFEDENSPRSIPHEKLFMLDLAWAISIHKSQGSQFEKVLIPVFTEHYIMLSRRLIYTALTRAEKECIFIGQKRALMMGINKKDQLKRNTLLVNFLKKLHT